MGKPIWSEQQVVTDDGVRLAVRSTGPADAPTVLAVHGYPDNSDLWEGVAAILAERFHVVVYDVRGAGRSDRPRARQAYRLDRLAADLTAVLEATAPGRKVHLLAHDWGSIQTWHAVTAEHLRGRFASYTSISGPCLDHAARWFRTGLRSPRRLPTVLRQILHSGYILYFHLPLLPELVWRTGLMRLIMRRLDPTVGSPSTADGVHGMKLYRANMLGRLSSPGHRYSDIPVQVLAPTGDSFVSAPFQTEIERWAPDLRVRRISGSHWVPRVRPQVVAAAAAELIEHTEGGPEPRALRRARVGGPSRGRFADRLVVVTGAGSGIGRATALAFAAEGAELVVTDIHPDGLAETVKLLRENDSLAGEYIVDSSDGIAVAGFAERVAAEHGVPDVVVNNAGVGLAGSFMDTTEAEWQRVLDVNLWGVIHGCRAFAELMVRRGEGGHIVNLASMAAYLPSVTLPAYATSKAAVLMLSECLRAELAGQGIGVSAICPGFVHTGITGSTRFAGLDEEQQRRKQQSSTRKYALRGFGPEKVARDILRAVQKDRAVVPSTPEAKAALTMSRLTPGLVRALAKVDLAG